MDAPVWKCAVIAAGMWQVYILEHIWCVYVYLPASISIFWSSHEPLEVTMQQERKYDKMTALWYEKRRKTLLQSCIQPRTVSLQPKCNQHWCYYKGHKTHKNYFSMLGVHLCYMIWVCVHYISCTLYNLTHLKQFSLPKWVVWQDIRDILEVDGTNWSFLLEKCNNLTTAGNSNRHIHNKHIMCRHRCAPNMEK